MMLRHPIPTTTLAKSPLTQVINFIIQTLLPSAMPTQPQQPLPPHVAIANDIRPFANQVALQPGQYAVAPKGSDADGYTSFVQGQEYMAENNVPRRLGYLEQNPEESRKSLARVAALTDEDGNPRTGRDGRTHLRDLPILPLHISAAVEGWRMWAWVLYDTRVQIDDIIQRMWIKQTRKQTLTKRMDDWRRARGGFGTNPREARPRHPIPGFIVSSKEDMKIMDRIYPLEQASEAQSEESNKIYLNTVWNVVFNEHGFGVQQGDNAPNADDDAMSFTYDGPATVFPPTTAPGPSNFQSNFQNTDNESMSFNNNEPPPVFPPTTAAGPSNFQSHPQPFDSRAFQNADDNGMSFNNNEPAPAFPPTTAPSPSNFQSHPQPFNSFQNTNNEGMLFNNNEPAPAFPPPTAPSSEHRHIPIDPALEELFPPHPPTQHPPPQLQPGFVPHPPPAFTPRLPPTQEAPSDPSSPPGRPPQPTRTPVRDRTTRAPLSTASAADPIFAAGQQQIGTHLPAPQTPGEQQEQNQLLEQALAAQRAGLPGTGAEAGQQRPAQQARHFSPQPPALLEAGRRAPEHMDAHRRTAAEMADLYVDYGDRRQLDLLVRYVEAHGLGGDQEIRGQLDRVAARGEGGRSAQGGTDGQLAPYFSTIVDVALDAGGRACVEDLANTYMWRHQVRNVLHAETLNPTVRFRTAIILSSVLGDQIDRLRARGYQIEDLSIPTGESLLSDDNIQRYGMLGGQNHEGHEARIRYINTVIVRLRQIWSFLYPEDYAEGRSPSVASSISSDSSWHSSSYGPYHLNPTHRRRPHQQPPPSQPPPPQTPPPPPSPPTTPPADNSDNDDDDSDDDDDDDNNNPLPTLPIPPNPSGPPGPPAPPPQPPQPTPPAPPAFMTTTQPQPQPTASAPPQPAASTPASTSARKRPLSTSRSPPVPRQRARLHSSSPPAPSSSPASAAIDAPLYTTDQVGAMFDRWDGRQAVARRGGGGDGGGGEDGGSWDGRGKGKRRAE
ncbi:uncharacterized protein K452DRAFT_331749 [Neofusicoccum parvum]|uniref:Uncharacterized protein K452DRAFT_331749 n=1 Tax=Neofusicoccum parvum TaxID=310453 RepID=A0ACB5SL08_9PEZI|nr:uncharacterized protein K452DRAFT_331749 [Neofusicoccum parvum]